MAIEDYEAAAKAKLPKESFYYFAKGSGNGFLLKQNRLAWNQYRLRPKVFQDIRIRDTSYSFFGSKLSMPFGICPMAMQRLAHPDGELAMARAAEKAGVVFTLGTLSSCSMEEVAAAAPKCVKFFQLFITKDRDLTKTWIRRAEKAGFKAIVVTVDAIVCGGRITDSPVNGNVPSNIKFSHIDGVQIHDCELYAAVRRVHDEKFETNLSWDDLRWVVGLTSLPVFVKGVLTKEDAINVAVYGAKGVIVSNHGARHNDGVAASIEALPEIVEAVGGKIKIIIDSGVTNGNDVLKALALGADMVFIGRPALWGLVACGQKGVENVIENVRHELDDAMALCGCSSLESINKDNVVHSSSYSKL